MDKEKLKLVLELYKDGKIDFDQAALLLDYPKNSIIGSFQRGGVIPNIPPSGIIV